MDESEKNSLTSIRDKTNLVGTPTFDKEPKSLTVHQEDDLLSFISLKSR